MGGIFEGAEDVVSQRGGVGEVLEGKGMLGDRGHGEEVRDAPGGQNQVVVADCTLRGVEISPVEIDTEDIRHPETCIRPAPCDLANGVDNGFGLDTGGGHLVEESCEEVVVVSVEEDQF